MSTSDRRNRLVEMVRTGDYSSQEELRKALMIHEFDVTQATLSRDLGKLGIVRIPTENGNFYRIVTRGESQDLYALVKIEVRSIEANDSIILIRTLPGRAQGVGWYLDGQETDLILGTVAGDDAVIVYPKHSNVIGELKTYLHSLVDIPEFTEDE